MMLKENRNKESVEVSELNERIKTAFREAVESNANENNIKLAMLLAGAKFPGIPKLFNRLMVELGYRKSSAEKKEILDTLLSSLGLAEEDNFNDAVAQVQESLLVNAKSAAATIRQWAIKNKRKYFKPATAEKSKYGNFDTRMHAWIEENIDATLEQFCKYVDENAAPSQVRFKPRFISLFLMTQRIKAKYAS